MRLDDLKPGVGSRFAKRRIGRGNASGTGTTAGKGTKGQKARSGGVKSSYRGMSSRMQRYGKLPGFHNRFRIEYDIVKLSDLDIFEADTVIDAEHLRNAGLVRGKAARPVKLLANGDVSKPFTVRLDKVTSTARTKLESAGGRVESVADASSST